MRYPSDKRIILSKSWKIVPDGWCMVDMIVAPRSASDLISLQIFSLVCESSPEVGSSNMSNDGSVISS